MRELRTFIGRAASSFKRGDVGGLSKTGGSTMGGASGSQAGLTLRPRLARRESVAEIVPPVPQRPLVGVGERARDANDGVVWGAVGQIGARGLEQLGCLRYGLPSRGVAVLLVEQFVDFAVAVCNQYYMVERGTVVAQGPTSALGQEVIDEYLAV